MANIKKFFWAAAAASILGLGAATIATNPPGFNILTTHDDRVLARIGELAWVDPNSDMRDDDAVAECLFNADQTVTFVLDGIVPYRHPVNVRMITGEDEELRAQLAKFSLGFGSVDPEPMLNPDSEDSSAMAHPTPLTGPDDKYFSYVPVPEDSPLVATLEKICKRVTLGQNVLRPQGF